MLAKTGIHCNSFNTILRWGSSRVLSHYIRTHSDVPEILYDKGNGCILGNSRYNLKFTVLETIHPRCVMDKAVNPNTATVYSSANSTTCFGLIGHHQVETCCSLTLEETIAVFDRIHCVFDWSWKLKLAVDKVVLDIFSLRLDLSLFKQMAPFTRLLLLRNFQCSSVLV